MSLRIEIDQLTKQYNEVIALRNFCGTIAEGDRIAILGHNGAGKSTLLNLLATLSKPTSGTLAFLENGQPLTAVQEKRRCLAYLSHEAMLYPDLTALENLRFVARMLGLADQKTDRDLMANLEMVGIDHAANRLIRTFSRGMRQRTSLARALLANPKLLLLDEPFSGLDYEGVKRLKALFTTRSTSWVMVTHHLALGYELANRIWILGRGKLKHQLKKEDVSLQDYLNLCQQAVGSQ